MARFVSKNGKTKKLNGNSVWKDTFYVEAYRLARSGLLDKDIARVLKIGIDTLNRYKRDNAAFADAINKGKEDHKDTGEELKGFFYDQLPENLQEIWDALEALEKEGSTISAIENILSDKGTKARQRLFLHALYSTTYNVNKALKAVNIDKRMLDRWLQKDPEFAELCDEIQFLKKNFFESRLMDLVQAGDVPTIHMVNRTINADRGYNPKIDVNVSGEIQHKHTVVAVTDLDLPLEVRKQILEAGRAQQEQKMLEAKVV